MQCEGKNVAQNSRELLKRKKNGVIIPTCSQASLAEGMICGWAPSVNHIINYTDEKVVPLGPIHKKCIVFKYIE